jgi:hypothetical protein
LHETKFHCTDVGGASAEDFTNPDRLDRLPVGRVLTTCFQKHFAENFVGKLQF